MNDNTKSNVLCQKIHADQNEYLVYTAISFISIKFIVVLIELFLLYMQYDILVYLWVREEFTQNYYNIHIVHIIYWIRQIIISLVSSPAFVCNSSKMYFKSCNKNTCNSKFSHLLLL